jgi:hypothetical protein
MLEPGYYWVLLDGDWQPAQWRARFGGECFEWLVIGEADAAYRDRITKVGPKQGTADRSLNRKRQKGYFVAPACQSSSFQRRGSLLFC